MLLPKYSKINFEPALIERLLVVANEAADAASVQSVANFRQQISVENKKQNGGFDPVTIADKQAELAIKQVVQNAFPEHGFFGEEYGQESGQGSGESSGQKSGKISGQTSENEVGSNSNQPLWIVDPIDGTRAYITGLPLWGTLIAVYDGNDVVLGMLEQPILKERFIGTQYLSGGSLQSRSELIMPEERRLLRTRNTEALNQAIVQTTTTDFFREDEHVAAFERVKDAVSMVRYGGDCYCYALLAMGFIDVVVERLLEPYDIAALIPIVQGAGGIVSNWSGESAVNGGEVVASANAVIHEQVLELLNARQS